MFQLIKCFFLDVSGRSENFKGEKNISKMFLEHVLAGMVQWCVWCHDTVLYRRTERLLISIRMVLNIISRYILLVRTGTRCLTCIRVARLHYIISSLKIRHEDNNKRELSRKIHAHTHSSSDLWTHTSAECKYYTAGWRELFNPQFIKGVASSFTALSLSNIYSGAS